MWTEFLENSAGIEGVYAGTPPVLEAVHIHEIGLNRDGPVLKLRFDLPEYPAKAPKKWESQGYNTVQVELCLGGVRDIALDGFSSDPIADIVLSGGEVIDVEVVSSDTRIRASADTVFISSISAYLDAG
ncbi:hypothetical protein SNS2_1737 [Streptomyces netropsis]|uniref:Immunity protein 50 n=1 Tax=Streptomyces syringium TaxID=76729 RepID=A0ABS4Y3U7_9ACTN|nr:Imm50 family immunity protein [Streptomyces syringium]MBP2403122.1 hypothetical protein [Streptomyces syringium]SPE52074.1 hypothetical protein SNS2_1737 [Streptomyces netropsis]